MLFKNYSLKTFITNQNFFKRSEKTLNVSKAILCKSSLSLRLYSEIRNENLTKSAKLKVAFFGTDLFSMKILFGLHKLLLVDKIKEINVITSTGPHHGREKSKHSVNIDTRPLADEGILGFCKKYNIKHYVWPEIKLNQSYKELFKDFDLGLVASFGHLIPANLIQVFP